MEHSWIDALMPVLLDLTVKATVILAIAGVVTTLAMRRASAAARHLVWSAAVAAVLALPIVRDLAPRWTIRAPALPSLAIVTPAAALVEPEAGR